MEAIQNDMKQKNAEIEEPKESDIYHFGVIAQITQNLKMPDGSMKIFLQGLARARHTAERERGENKGMGN